METNKIFDSKVFAGILLGIAGLLVLIFVFMSGVFVGTKKAEFSFRWADQYHRNFAGPQGGFFGDFMGMGKEFTNSNGAFGQIIKINLSAGSGQTESLTVKDRDNVEKIVLVNNETIIIYQKNNLKISDLKAGDNIIVLGDPNDKGQILAEFIRVMPTITKNRPAGKFIFN